MGRMPMMPRFRLPVSQEYAESCLAMAVAAEVESRGHSISPDGDFGVSGFLRLVILYNYE